MICPLRIVITPSLFEGVADAATQLEPLYFSHEVVEFQLPEAKDRKSPLVAASEIFELPRTININEQIDIVRVLDLLIIKNKSIELNYKQKLKDLEDLKKSILQKAFTGELTNKEETSSLKQVAEPTTSYSKN